MTHCKKLNQEDYAVSEMQCPAVGIKLRSVQQIGTLDHYTDRCYIVFQYLWVHVFAKSSIENDALQVFGFNQ